MFIEVVANPNCQSHPLMVFEAYDTSQPINSVQIEKEGHTLWVDVIGVHESGLFQVAQVQKISDSGAGFAFLVYGGEWGIRLRHQSDCSEWNLQNNHQWGEPYLVCSDETGIK